MSSMGSAQSMCSFIGRWQRTESRKIRDLFTNLKAWNSSPRQVPPTPFSILDLDLSALKSGLHAILVMMGFHLQLQMNMSEP